MRDRLRFIALLCLTASVCGNACAGGSQQTKRANQRYSIAETPCGIDMGSSDQSVDMGAMPTERLAQLGEGAAQPMSIRLVGCNLQHFNAGLAYWRYFRLTVEGYNDQGLFGLDGRAHGVALKMVDPDGNITHPGEPLTPGQRLPMEQKLDYSLRLVSNHQALRSGDFHSTLRFRMDYY